MMNRKVAALVAAALAASSVCGSVFAHHSYGQYDRCRSVSLEGTIESVTWANPHVVIMLKTDEGTFRVEWDNLQQLARTGVVDNVLGPGERIVVTGSRNRDPETKIVTLLTELRRPSDGWSWSRVLTRPQECGT